ncbi:hypothetical protein WISP_79166 [Willisornis vidua]|uniref:Reverse transcriptase domain-containing protein n=1 Tax=Willisornis vidua TaxID=1566151 RepID=A0ABQ9D540_9PASS|nr:hypothetical protein WISP_79166 [Willisornis vidua]
MLKSKFQHVQSLGRGDAMGNMKDKGPTQMKCMIGKSQQGLIKGKSCLTNLTIFYDKATCVEDVVPGMVIAHLDCSKAFDVVSHSLLLEKLMAM